MLIANGVIIIIVYMEDCFFNNLYQNKNKKTFKKTNQIKLDYFKNLFLFVYHLISRWNGFPLWIKMIENTIKSPASKVSITITFYLI